ncbi:unnamed protein product [Blepharisma stoltei]|uniref:Uncharacterized protein n=1 Tax=Blepharisma stoltei TaxID=1481888 RepID=A0AAU9K769_9CILI|nr:unnamed protein product [Blepharisma stoltei]
MQRNKIISPRGTKNPQESSISDFKQNPSALEEKYFSVVNHISSILTAPSITSSSDHELKLDILESQIQKSNENLEQLITNLEDPGSEGLKRVLTAISEKLSEAQCQMLILSIKDSKKLSDDMIRQVIAKAFTDLNSFIWTSVVKSSAFDFKNTFQELKELIGRKKKFEIEYERMQQLEVNELKQKIEAITSKVKMLDGDLLESKTMSLSFSPKRLGSFNSINLSKSTTFQFENSMGKCNLEQPYPKDTLKGQDMVALLEENSSLKENIEGLKEKLRKVREESELLQEQYQEMTKFVKKYQMHMKSIQSDSDKVRLSRSNSFGSGGGFEMVSLKNWAAEAINEFSAQTNQKIAEILEKLNQKERSLAKYESQIPTLSQLLKEKSKNSSLGGTQSSRGFMRRDFEEEMKLNSQIQVKDKYIHSLTEKLTSIDLESKILKKSIDELTGKYEALSQTKEEEINELQQKISYLEEVCLDYENKFEEAKNREIEIENDKEALKEEAMKIAKELNDAKKNKGGSLNESAASFKIEPGSPTLKNSPIELEKIIKAQRDELLSVYKNYDNLQKELDQLKLSQKKVVSPRNRSPVVDLENGQQSLQDELKEAKRTSSNAIKKIKDGQIKIAQLESELAAANKKLKENQARILDLERLQQINKKKPTKDASAERIKLLEEKIRGIEAEKMDLTKSNEYITNYAADIQKEGIKERDTLKVKLRELEDKCKIQEKEISLLGVNKKELENLLNKLNAEIETKNHEIHDLNQQISNQKRLQIDLDQVKNTDGFPKLDLKRDISSRNSIISSGAFTPRPTTGRKILSEDERQKINSFPNLNAVIENLCQELDEDNPNLLIDRVIDLKNDRDALYVDLQKLYDIVSELQEELEEQDINQLYNCIGRLKADRKKSDEILNKICKMYDSSPHFILDHIKADSSLVQTLREIFVSKNPEIIEKAVKGIVNQINEIKRILKAGKDSEACGKIEKIINEDPKSAVLPLQNISKSHIESILMDNFSKCIKFYGTVDISMEILEHKMNNLSVVLSSLIKSSLIKKKDKSKEMSPCPEPINEEKRDWNKIKEEALKQLHQAESQCSSK